jgi:hypothetical protein
MIKGVPLLMNERQKGDPGKRMTSALIGIGVVKGSQWRIGINAGLGW